jgi:OmpA family
MYLQSYPETTLGLAARRVYCIAEPIILDDFLVGDYRIRPSHYEKLMDIRELAKRLQDRGFQPFVLLRGFTDNTGKERMNRGLSDSRAFEVQNFLAREGVPVQAAAGAGVSNTPPNTTDAGRRKNRRVEVRFCVLMPPQSGTFALNLPDLLRQADYRPTSLLAGAPIYPGFGSIPHYTPWRERWGLRPPYLKFPEGPPPDLRKIPETVKEEILQADEERKYNRRLPKLPPGKTFKDWVFDWLRDHHVPKVLWNKIWDAVVGKDLSVVGSLLTATGFSAAEKNAFLGLVGGLSQVPVR